MRWKIVLEGTDEFGSARRSELTIDKDMERLSAGEIGFSVEDGRAIMAHLQQVVVNQQCEAYVLTSRFCMDCEGFRRVKDYTLASALPTVNGPQRSVSRESVAAAKRKDTAQASITTCCA